MNRDSIRWRQENSEVAPALRALVHTTDGDSPTGAQLAELAAKIKRQAAATPVVPLFGVSMLPRRSLMQRVAPFAAVTALAAGAALWMRRPSTEKPVVATVESQDEASAGAPSLIAGEAGWMVSGGARNAYEVRSDASTKRDGHATLHLAPIADTHGGYGNWMRNTDAAPYRGKRIRISAFVKSAGPLRRSDFWGRVQASSSPADGNGLVSAAIPIAPNADWKHAELIFDVPENGIMLQYGFGVAGGGSMWIDVATVEVVGLDVPVTQQPAPSPPATPTSSDSLLVPLASMISNLDDPSPRYIKVTVQFEMTDQAAVKAMKDAEPKVRDGVLAYLAGLKVADTIGPASRTKVHDGILKCAVDIVGKDKVKNVLFTDYVVQ